LHKRYASAFLPGTDQHDWLGTPAYKIRALADGYQTYFMGGGTITDYLLGFPDVITAYLDEGLDALSPAGHAQRWGILIGLGLNIGSDAVFAPDGSPGGKRQRAPEYAGGRVSEDRFLDVVLDYLGPGYRCKIQP
jgi:hypothetical protein